jgi:N,N'-diacetyllegionaminate synthase
MFIIAEIGQAHEGSIELAHSYIDLLSTTGVDAVKFQVHIADAESSIFEPFRIKMQSKDKSRFEYWKRMEFSIEQWRELKEHCEERGMEFLASPFSNAAVDLLEELEVMQYKIGSGEVNNFLMLEKIAKTGKRIIISSGMSSYAELDNTVKFLKKRNVDFSILQCTTAYPTLPRDYGFNVIKEIKDRYGVPVGYSDHSAKIEAGITAFVMGAEILEFHAIISRKNISPDATSSLEISEISQLVNAIRNIKIAFQHPVDKSDNTKFSDLKNIFEKSLAVNKDLKVGHILKFEDLEAKKPKGYGIKACLFEEVIGNSLKSDLKKWDFLNLGDIR